MLGLFASACGEATPTANRDAAGVPAAPVLFGVDAVAAGGGRTYATGAHVCAIRRGGLVCWGAGRFGQLGSGGTPREVDAPVEIFGAASNVRAIAAGEFHSCASVDGAALCWGRNDSHQLGLSSPRFAPRPRRVPSVPSPVTRIAAGDEHSCAVAAGELWCWGRNRDGETGEAPCDDAYRPCRALPHAVEGIVGDLRAIALGGNTSCVATEAGVACWGGNEHGELGDGSLEPRFQPTRVSDLAAGVSDIAAGRDHVCALANGSVWCWGSNVHGQLGDGTTQDRRVPVRVVGLERGVERIAAGSFHTCAAAGAAVFCWGSDAEGQVSGTRGASINPEPVHVLEGKVRALAAGEDVTCAVSADGALRCWGDDDFGQLGRADARARAAPKPPLAATDAARFVDRNGDGIRTVACIGDSNTQALPSRPRGWCELLRDRMPDAGFATINRGEAGATAVAHSLWKHSFEHLDYVLAQEPADAVIAAYGTNDIAFADASPAAIVDALRALRRRARSAGIDFFVALVPRLRDDTDPLNARVAVVNRAIFEAFPPDEIVDFAGGFDASDYFDAIHLGESGHHKRAAAAWRTLAAAMAER